MEDDSRGSRNPRSKAQQDEGNRRHLILVAVGGRTWGFDLHTRGARPLPAWLVCLPSTLSRSGAGQRARRIFLPEARP